jgi:2-keto-4-pentenoate hydratase/2-oxohepta-3-ene-1,7-dioic acid hydratase in catechol pathway
MKWCRYQSGADVAYGVIEESSVTAVHGSPFERYTRTANTVPLSRVKLLVPVIPPTFYAAGVNYREHVTEMAHRRGLKPEFPPQADVGYRANNALIATDEPIVIPADATDQVQYEGELVVVIGKQCKRVSEAAALDYVFGYTIGNDVSERTWQRGDRTFWRGKNADTFKPMGPWIVTGLDPDDLRVTIRLNGKEMFTYAVKDAIFGPHVHQPDEPVPDAPSGRRAVDGHGRRDGEHEGRGRRRGGGPRYRRAAQSRRARAAPSRRMMSLTPSGTVKTTTWR